jgi:hypothetical protein
MKIIESTRFETQAAKESLNVVPLSTEGRAAVHVHLREERRPSALQARRRKGRGIIGIREEKIL